MEINSNHRSVEVSKAWVRSKLAGSNLAEEPTKGFAAADESQHPQVQGLQRRNSCLQLPVPVVQPWTTTATTTTTTTTAANDHNKRI